MTDKKIGREVLFRRADGVGIGARIGTAKYDRMCKNPKYVKVEPKSFKERADEFDEAVVEALCAVKGVGKTTAIALGNAGFISIQGIADSTPEDIAKAIDISKGKAENIHEASVKHIEALKENGTI